MHPDKPKKEGAAYAHGYFDEMVDLLSRRSASSDAAFFTPTLKPGMRLLDCGCGPGTLTAGLAQVVAPGHVVAVDVDAGQIDLARQNAEKLGITNVTFQVADAYSLPFADAEFDAVFAHTLLQHLPDPRRGLTEMHRVLRTPGVIGIREEDWGGTFFHPSSKVLEDSIQIALKDWSASGGDPYLPRRYRELLRQAAFTHVRMSATAVARETDEARKWSELSAGYLLAPATKKRVLEMGLADENSLERIRTEWLRWGQDPNAFFCMTFCEAVALKS